MRSATLVALASCVASAVAHATQYGVWLNGQDQCEGRDVYIRSPPNTDPVKDLTSDDMACNVNNKAVPQSIPVKAGDKLTLEWRQRERDDSIIDDGHHGPILTYISKSSDNLEWTKLFEEGYDAKTKEWAIDKLRASGGQHTIIIPNVPAGDYIIRDELIALHSAYKLYSEDEGQGAQCFISCTQITVTSDGPDELPEGVIFPGEYTDSTPGILFDLYTGGDDPSTYEIPGPAVWSKADKGGEISRVGTPGEEECEPAENTSKNISKSEPKVSSVKAVALGEQCGGASYTGSTACEEGECVVLSKYYSECQE